MKWAGKDFKNDILEGSLVKKNFIDKEKLGLFIKKEKDLGKIWQLYIFEKWFSNYASS
jgi:hypothetical protein